MKSKKDLSKNSVNSAMSSFQHERPKNFMRNRFIAMVIDFIIIAFICQLAFTLFGTPDWSRYLQTEELIIGLPATDPLVIERMNLFQECFVVTLAIGTLYEALLLLLFGASVGKFAFGLRVVNAKEGTNFLVGKLMLILRVVLKVVSIYLSGIGFILPFIVMCIAAFANEKGRSGFDVFAGTKVIDTNSD